MEPFGGAFRDGSVLLSAVGADQTTDGIDVSKYSEILLAIATTGATLDIKIKGSFSHAKPDFGSAASESNRWFYIGAYDLSGAALNVGSTGIVFAASTACNGYMVNCSRLKWMAIEVDNFAAGTVTVECFAGKN
jgi:hypothetical protein